MSAVDHWRQMILREHAQTDRIRGPRPTDHWTQLARNFKDDPHRTGDEMVDELRARVKPGETLIDVGAGGGRLALPLALTCNWVYAVEPSPSMCDVLRETAGESGIENVSVTQASWEDASVETADVVLSSHVVYVVQEIEPFLRKKEAHARRLVLTVAFQSPPPGRHGQVVGTGASRGASAAAPPCRSCCRFWRSWVSGQRSPSWSHVLCKRSRVSRTPVCR